jgi:hypothetical protein
MITQARFFILLPSWKLINIFYELAFQISEADANRSLTKHRKIASSFRDTQLFEIFQLSSTLLRTAYNNRKSLNFSDESQVS